MSIKYLIDENLPPSYTEQLLRCQPDLTVLSIGDEDAPSKGTLDPEILLWCEANEFILVTNNRSSMPVHLTEHLAEGHHILGILVLRDTASMGEILEDLVLIFLAADESEYQDLISYIPLKR
ncbi:MAG: hypothetical protein F6K31_18550 [Symploca sp. SIO2G7]|nr:hypothetical protein [Symploca sp. SIO2G7]